MTTDTAAGIAAAVAAGRLTAGDAVETALARIAARDPGLNAFTDVTAARARARAAAIDAERAAGRSVGPLAGVPFAVKNLFDVAGLPTRAGSMINRERAPATRDGALVRRLEAAGAVLVGALNMGEYAYDFTGENAHDGPSRNPHDRMRMTGGSSGGSGGAVAAGMVPLALGSDTNGSIRVPSAFCGTFGLKPTFGRLSRAGSFPFVGSFDHLGPLARSVADLALPTTRCRARIPTIPGRRPRPIEPSRTRWRRASRPCGSRSPAATSPAAARRIASRRCASPPRLWAPTAPSRSRKRPGRGPPPSSSRRRKPPASTSTGCASAPATTTRRCATA